MESIRVDVCYRPLKVAWAISAGDIEGFRSAVRVSYALWGGRFNPIVIVDRDGAEDLIDLFRVDAILPVGASDSVRSFVKRFSYLPRPFFDETVFVGNGQYGSPCQMLDVQNALSYLYGSPEWDAVKKQGFRLYSWSPEDSLADVLMIQLGEYPSSDGTAANYPQLVKDAAAAQQVDINPASNLPADTFEHPSIPFLSRYGLEPHHSARGGWDTPGFYMGDAANLDDLVCFWNIRAANVPLLFVDPKHLDRYGDTIASWEKVMRQLVSRRRDEFDRFLAVWTSVDDSKDTQDGLRAIMRPFEGKASTLCRVPKGALSETGIRPPMMYFGEVSTLGIVGSELGKTRISFALEQKPFDDDVWFHTQRLVASISFIAGLYGDEQNTLTPPYVPELNEFYARTMHFEYDKLRIEPGRIGLIIDPYDRSKSIYALPVGELIERILDLAGFSARLSEGGLTARQLIAQLGGVDRARPFKIPGVRRLIKAYGPTESFTKNGALQLIGGRDPQNPAASFKDHHNLYIEPRPHGTELTPDAVFAFLVDKGLFRMGAELTCPNCRLPSWTALDALKQRATCDLCGSQFDAARQLIGEDWRYRRSGVLGKERNAQGAIPVVLTLQQFKSNFHGLTDEMYSPSLDLTPKAGFNLPTCEIDFLWIDLQPYPEKTVVIIGECKDRGGGRGKESGTIDRDIVENLRRVADALPRKRFQTYIVLAKLCPFTADEIALAKTLNQRHRPHRAILLTATELEPYHFFERTRLKFREVKPSANSAEDLAIATDTIYFKATASR
jgi:hypothetical protein